MLPGLARDLRDRAVMGSGFRRRSVIHQNGDHPVLLDGVLDQRRQVVVIRQIGPDELGAGTGGCLRAAAGIPARDHDLSAFGDKQPGDLDAQPRCGPGNDGHFAAQAPPACGHQPTPVANPKRRPSSKRLVGCHP